MWVDLLIKQILYTTATQNQKRFNSRANFKLDVYSISQDILELVISTPIFHSIGELAMKLA